MLNNKTTKNKSCDEIRNNLSALLDDEELTHSLKSVKDHVKICSGCASYQLFLSQLQNNLRSNLKDSFDEEKIWNSVKQEIDLAIPESESVSVGRRHWIIGVGMAAAVMFVVLIANSLLRETPTPSLVSEAIRDFETFQLRDGMLDVDSSESKSIMQWMSARLDFNLPNEVMPPTGYQLVGGRLCSFLNRRLAFFHYQKASSKLSMYVMKADGLEVPTAGKIKALTHANGLTSVTWQHNGFAFVLLSELPAAEVEQFSRSMESSA